MLINTPIKTRWLCQKCLVYPQLKTIVNEMTGSTYYLVECPKCLCHTRFYETEDEAKVAWDDKKILRTYIIDDKNMKTDSKKNKLWDKDKVKTVFGIVACTLMACIILYGGCYVLPREFIRATREARREAQRTIVERKEEEKQRKPLLIQYEKVGKFHKVILEGHEYWYSENFKNNVGFCHSESCPCKTNKMEVVQ